MKHYYNEFDPFAAQWIRELISKGLVPPGDVDERSIEDVLPSDLKGYTSAHWFAGVAVWPYALRLAGWPDDRPIWTGSCPCQPFSAAGKGDGFADERHLWPAWLHLISQCRPPNIVGEQVASKGADPWLDLVQDDLETLGYAFGAVAFPSAGVGAPHIRDRTYWAVSRLGHADRSGSQRHAGHGGTAGRAGQGRPVAASGLLGGMADPQSVRSGLCDAENIRQADAQVNFPANTGNCEFDRPRGQRFAPSRPGPVNDHWRDADWLFCRDGKWRPVEPGTSPLVTGAANRVGRLRGYGNAINAEAARAFIEATGWLGSS